MLKEKEEKYGPRLLEGELVISDFNEWAKKYQVSTLHIEPSNQYRMDYYRDKLSIIQETEPVTVKGMVKNASHEVRNELIKLLK